MTITEFFATVTVEEIVQFVVGVALVYGVVMLLLAIGTYLYLEWRD